LDEIVVFEKGVGHIERKFQKKGGGFMHQQLMASEIEVPGLSRGVVCVILSLAV